MTRRHLAPVIDDDIYVDGLRRVAAAGVIATATLEGDSGWDLHDRRLRREFVQLVRTALADLAGDS